MNQNLVKHTPLDRANVITLQIKMFGHPLANLAQNRALRVNAMRTSDLQWQREIRHWHSRNAHLLSERPVVARA